MPVCRANWLTHAAYSTSVALWRSRVAGFMHMALTLLRAASFCGLLFCLAGLSGANAYLPGTLVLTEGGNDVRNATLLMVSQAGGAA